MRRLLALVSVATACASLQAQTIGPDFAGSYTASSLGSVPGLPPRYGGLTFLDANTLLIGGSANTAAGSLYTIGVTRGADGSITGFSGTAQLLGGPSGTVGEYNDGGVAFGPGGVLFTARWPINGLGQTKPGSIDEDKIIDLDPLGVQSSLSAINFVPAGFGGEGRIKLVTYGGGAFYSASLTPDGNGTYDLAGLVQVDVDPDEPGTQTLPGGPEGFVYITAGNPGFATNSMLLSEYRAGLVAAYSLDADGNPLLGTRRVFVDGLSGAEGAAIDPVTGDFLFSTFGGGDQVLRVSGFAAPIPEPSTWLLMALGLAGLASRAGARRPG